MATIPWCLAAGEATVGDRLAAARARASTLRRERATRAPSRDQRPPRRRGAESFADDLVEDRGVVPTRAVSHCDVLKVILQIYDLSRAQARGLFFSP